VGDERRCNTKQSSIAKRMIPFSESGLLAIEGWMGVYDEARIVLVADRSLKKWPILSHKT
jgi:hypothetical protein